MVHPLIVEGFGDFQAKEADPHITELAMLLLGMKPVLYTHFDVQDLSYLEKLCRHFELVFLIPEQAPATTTRSRKAMLIGKNREALRRAETAWNQSVLSRDWGLALGYPECCVDFYADFKHAASLGGEGEIIRRIAANTSAPPPHSFMMNNVVNMFSRFPATSVGVDGEKYHAMHAMNAPLDLRALHVIPWHPCSYACVESLSRGRKIFDFLRLRVPTLAAKTKVCLQRCVLFFGQYEFIVFKGRREGREWICDGVVPPFSLLKGKPWDELRAGTRIGIEEGTAFVREKSGRRVGLPSSAKAVMMDFTAGA